MPDRLSRLKAKLLRRSPIPKADGADPVHPISNSPSAPQLVDANKSPAYSIISSPDCSDALGSASERRPLSLGPNEPVSAPQSDRQPTPENRTCTSSPEAHTSSLHTPLTGPSSPLETTPLPTPQHSDSTSFQSTHKAQASTPGGNQLTPTLNTVIEWPAYDRRPSAPNYTPSSGKRPSLAIRRQSLLPATHQHLIGGLLEANIFSALGDQISDLSPVPSREMVQRRIWVKRPGGSATLVPCMEDAVVDELRDQVIMKYVNSLGRSFDSPDIVIRIAPREGSNRQTHPERLLSPEEVLSSLLDAYYPGGQKIEEALTIEAPTRRTPKPSPRHSIYTHHSEPGEHGDYFPLMPVNPTSGSPAAHPHPVPAAAASAPSISILNTGIAPPLPSPGNRRRHHQRPPLTRHTTNSPTIHGHIPVVTGMLYSICLLGIVTDIHRNRPLSTLSASSNNYRSFWFNAPSTCSRVPTSQITHPSRSLIATFCTQNKSGDLPWCSVWWIDRWYRSSDQRPHCGRQHHQPETPGSFHEKTESALEVCSKWRGGSTEMAPRRFPSSVDGYPATCHERIRCNQGDPTT